MVALYVDLIKKGLKTIDDVPSLWKAGVEAELARLAAEEGA